MKGPKWLIMFMSALLLTFVVWAGINIAIDPFGVFGTSLRRWDAYSQTLNPRTGKVSYLQEHWDDYDSYIVGSSSAASYLPATLEKYSGGSWYNMFHYGADISYDKQLVKWLIENDDVEHIVLVLGLNEAGAEFVEEDLTDRAPCAVTGKDPLTYFADFLFAGPSYAKEKLTSAGMDTEMPQAFDVFVTEDGTYDKRLRDVEAIAGVDKYLEKNESSFWHAVGQGELTGIENCVSEVEEIKALCDASSVKLTVILSPVYEGQLSGFSVKTLNSYFSRLSDVTEYWNFGISSVSYDPRYFYDATHTRNAAADMVLARVFGDEESYAPDDFGVFCRKGEVPSVESMTDAAAVSAGKDEEISIPILLYHHIDPDSPESGTVIHPETFASHMELLLENGYTTITFTDIINYVEKGTELPDKPVIITFDDGYYSNYEYAFPVLRENSQKATIFVIGCSVGHYETYKDTELPITSHFGEKEMQEMTASGCIDIQSHTFDMHQWPPYEDSVEVRDNILPLEGETETDYISALSLDAQLQQGLFGEYGMESPIVVAFPTGKWTDIANVVLAENGVKVTLTTDSERVNTLVRGLPQSLVGLGRMNVDGTVTPEDILRYCGAGK